MRLRAAIATSFLLLPCLGLQAAEFPYQATVNADDVYVRSGPGQDYYATEKLKQGEVIEVYRHDPGGWYAVRPPGDSHSYISARHVKEIGGGLLEVTTDGIVARVGSTLSAARDVWQVKLRKGEKLEILDASATETEAWYRVSPPAGEFRWIYGRYLSRTDDEPQDRSDFADEPSQSPIRPRGVVIEHRDHDLKRPAEDFADTRPTTTRAVSYESRRSRDEDLEPAEPRLPATPRGSRAARGESDEPSPSVAATSQWLELEKVEADLSFAVCEENNSQVLDSLLDRAVTIADTTRSERERQRAEELIERIRRFAALGRQIRRADDQLLATIQQQQQDLRRPEVSPRGSLASREPVGELGVPTSTTVAATAAADSAASVELVDSRFDGEGRLVPVYSKRIGAPQYALLDGENRVRSYVTAAPGVNLRAYEGRYIGIVGSRGYSTELKSPHVVAQRVDVLNPRLQ